MTPPAPASHPFRRRERLMLGASLAALTGALAAGPAAAQTLAGLRMGMGQGGVPAAAAAVLAGSQARGAGATPAMAQAAARALANQGQLGAAVSLAQQAQAAARAAALGLHPNVPDGLVMGGLQVVANPVLASADPTGTHTWQGADLPTASAQNPDQVTVVQTDPRAILSWQTFNVGPNTTLTFQQQAGGVAQPSWVALNRVVGQLDPRTGLRDPNFAPAPSQILGSIKADGTVLVINQNGVMFGAGAQVNVNSLVASSLEVGHALEMVNGVSTALTLGQRNQEFLSFGLLGFAEQLAAGAPPQLYQTFSPQAVDGSHYDPLPEGEVQAATGAAIDAGSGGFILMMAPRVVNGAALTAPQGQVSLVSGREVTLTASTGDANSVDPDLRGLFVLTQNLLANGSASIPGDYVNNTADGLISAPGGYVSLQATLGGAVLDAGVLTSTTSVSRNGYVNLQGGDIGLAPGAVIAITPDDGPATIPQDPGSLAAFKTSRIRIGDTLARIDIGANSLIYAPSANISIGADPGQTTVGDGIDPQASRVFIDTGAIIDAAGLTDVEVPGSQNSIKISPVTQNELANDPNYRSSFLNGATLYIDPRLSGVLPNGVAWVGSPLITAANFAQQVGVTASELMTRGGNVTLGAQSFSPRADTSQAPDVIVVPGASIDISGGWRTFQAGLVQTSFLVDTSGQVVNVGAADPNDTYVAVYNGFTSSQPRWGVTQTFYNPLLTGPQMEGAYTEGADAGTLTVKASAIALDGAIHADAFAGPQQILAAQAGTASGSIYGDARRLQGAPSQLPAGGYLDIQALGIDASGSYTGGGDIAIVSSADYAPLPADFAYGQEIGFGADGSLIVPTRPATSVLPQGRLDVISLNADALSASGLSQLTVQTSGKVDVAAGATLTLQPGGAFEATAGRSITIDGAVVVPSGAINLATGDFIENAGLGGSVFLPDAPGPGSFDITVNGRLDTAGRWVNDFHAAPDALVGSAWLNGGSITLFAAPSIDPGDVIAPTTDPNAPTQSTDISGSILINAGGVLNVNGGGYVSPNGAIDVGARGGDVSLFDETAYFQFVNDIGRQFPNGLPGFRVTTIQGNGQPLNGVRVLPDAINARVSIADGSILAHGFGGGGTFTLTTPQFALGAGQAATGTELPLDFFSATGFAAYDIKSYKTDLIPNAFDNGLGGFNAVLATQTVEIGAGQVLSLNQSFFSPILSTTQLATLRNFATGGDLGTVVKATSPADAWDQRPVSLTLGGLIDLKVDAGGLVTGAPGASLTVGGLVNQGDIVLHGGKLTQSEVLPALYVSTTAIPTAIGVHTLADIFTTNADGSIAESAPNAMGLKDVNGVVLTNGQVAASVAVYLLGALDQGEGVRLDPGSVTDLSGAAIVNPNAVPKGAAPPGFVTGKVIDAGTLQAVGAFADGAPLFRSPPGVSSLKNYPLVGQGAPDALNAEAGARIDLAGAAAVFDEPIAQSALPGAAGGFAYAPTPVWSNGGALVLGAGGAVGGASIDASGGAPLALGGVLSVLDPVLVQSVPAVPAFDLLSADQIMASGFDTLIARGSLSSQGDVTLALRRSLFVTSRPDFGLNVGNAASRDLYSPTISSGGGNLEVDAPYIGLMGDFQTLSRPDYGAPGGGSVTLKAATLDITGAVLFDQSVASVTLDATGDVRLIGVAPWQQTFNSDPGAVGPSLEGQLAVNGDLTLTAGQVYPTTGTRFTVSSAGADGHIVFAKSEGPTPATPYSAGGALTVQAANIVQGGVIRAPLGSLSLGGDTPLLVSDDGVATQFAPVTQSLTLAPGSVTSVSTDGLVIPYGTTTDQIEWFFSPTNGNPLTAPPAGVLRLAGQSVDVAAGSTVDLKGGGDVYAYEFIPGIGGSRDVLDQFNPDVFTSNNGYQYADQRQVYAIVPGLSAAGAALYDPIYSADYAGLYGASQAGLRVYLNAAPGLAAGWYTLLPARYALLPGGMRVVRDTGAGVVPPVGGQTLPDGTAVTSGYFGVAGVDARSATPLTFDVQSQAVVLRQSQIALTFGNQTFTAQAAHAGTAVPALPIDAGRLILTPGASLALDGTFQTGAAVGGRGSEVDISGASLEVVAGDGAGSPSAGGAILLAADSLSALDAASLFLGGTRVDNADGTTSLTVTTGSIAVDAGASLSAPEILMATDGAGASLTIADGAAVTATGKTTDAGAGDYLIAGLAPGSGGTPVQVQSAQGGFIRVANGPERLVDRTAENAAVTPGAVSVGAATLSGTSVELESSGDLRVSPGAAIAATSLALGASSVTFAGSAAGLGGLVITPELQALFGRAAELTLQSPNVIGFDGGTYRFGNVSLDAPGLADDDGGAVVIDAGVLTLANSSLAAASCAVAGGPGCGTGTLSVSAGQIAFGTGAVAALGFGGGVTLASSGGIVFDGAASFDAGDATLALRTAFLGDRGTGVPGATLPSLTLTTTGNLDIANPAVGGPFTPPAGTPGSSLTLNGAQVAIDGTEVRATAGALRVTAQDGISVTGGTRLETPGYARTFGDSADPVTVSAPGGFLSLVAEQGDVAISGDSRLSVAGSQGQSGILSLAAQNGQVYAFDGATPVALGSVLDAGGPGSGASLSLDTGGSFDLAGFAEGAGQAFTGTIAIRTGAGSLQLLAGDTLRAQVVSLTADGGMIDDAGTIDVSGVTGGEVDLYGAQGVLLRSGALIDAHANGYGALDTRQASGGNVTLGTAGSGAIEVDQGAAIDVSARQSGNRLVPMSGGLAGDYTYVAADQGGTVAFRAPVIDAGGVETVNVGFAGAVRGASSVVLEGYRQWDLASLASNPDYVGVSIVDGQAVLDTGAAAAGKINPLTDQGAGTLVDFVQGFDVSADYGSLGGLAGQANFHARPGVELDYAGNVVLSSNWNLGAGTVDIAGAVKAGLMAAVPDQPGEYYVVPGAEAAILAGYTTLTYRVDGKVTGEPGILTLRAGGNLDLQGSITDGFFQFHDQTDPHYLDYVLGGGDRTYQASLTPGCNRGDCSTVGTWSAGALPPGYVSISFPGGGLADPYSSPAPYSAAANAPDAAGSLPGGLGDPLGSAQLFPLLPTADSGTRAVDSWSYRLVAGADLGGAGGAASVNPLATVAGGTGTLTVEGEHVYGYSGHAGSVAFGDSLLLGVIDESGKVTNLTAAQWYKAFLDQNPGLGPNSYTSIALANAPATARAALQSLATQFFAGHPGQAQFTTSGVTTTLSLAADFMAFVSANFAKVAPGYTPPAERPITTTTYATAPTLVRTGDGTIQMAAAGNIDLRNGATPQMLDPATGRIVAATPGHPTLGGAAVYTAGHLADLGQTTAVDEATGQILAVNLGANATSIDYLAAGSGLGYRYGAQGAGYAGILVADPVWADGGGAIGLAAGGSVLGRRDTALEGALGGVGDGGPFTQVWGWIGSGAQPWRTGSIGVTVNAQIDPQLFQEGIGALAGGDITVRAGGDISDISLVSTASETTAAVVGEGGRPAVALATFGGGTIDAFAAGDLLGGRVDVASGEATLAAVGQVASAGLAAERAGPGAFVQQDNTLRLRLTDAGVDISAGGGATLQGIAALGVTVADPSQVQTNLDGQGFYGPEASVSILANGPVLIQNSGADVITTATAATQDAASAVYPGSLQAVSLTAGLAIDTTPSTVPGAPPSALGALLVPSPTGTLTLIAAGDIAPATLAMLDADPIQLPGAFSNFTATIQSGVTSGVTFAFPAVTPGATDVTLRLQHAASPTHAGDPTPNRIISGGSILDLIFSSPKAARISAGEDIVDAAFFGQNLSPTDVTRISAGRDITATTTLERAEIAPGVFGDALPAVQGDTFVIGGPGAFFLEAGRDAGPFLNSAVTDGLRIDPITIQPVATGVLTWGGGIQSVGNLWNPWLAPRGADIFTEFGVGKGQDYAALAGRYLSPANFASLPDALFQQTVGPDGASVANRSEEIYAVDLLTWMRAIAPSIIAKYEASLKFGPSPPSVLVQFAQSLESGGSATLGQALALLPQVADQKMPLIPWLQLNYAGLLTRDYGTLDVSYQQAFDAFQTLPALNQRQFLLKDVYFNELIQTSIPTSVSYLQYGRGYEAVNTLFPGALGYTQNDLSGGSNGANATVETGNLDLRLSTIQTDQGGDIVIVGPGGGVLAGSTVSTARQAATRVYGGGALFAGNLPGAPAPAVITQIPVGFEGILTLNGGAIDSFTDGAFLLNQSRLFTEAGGDVALWSSNSNLNAGQGPKTSADFPPIVVRIDADAYSQVDAAAGVSGAGIAAFQPDPTAAAPDVFLIAPRGTVDAGAGGVRSAGDIFVAAFQVANAANFQVGGQISGLAAPAAINVAAQTSASAASAAAAQAAQAAAAGAGQAESPSVIIVEVLGFAADVSDAFDDDKNKRRRD